MITVFWLTQDLTLQPDIVQACAFAQADLRIGTNLHELPTQPVDVILWSPAMYDETTYLALTKHCYQVLQLIERERHHNRLCPIKSKGAPRYYIVIPFDPEEVGTIIRGFAERARKAGTLRNVPQQP
jgi:hypothetical protein